ncbi:hypothetical protein C8J57DRAFT_1494072 [Mycena rebaudengoi]|nr:hypothetical protein C8J57DRAFT_1494072 [Mycena rebaudengoi]
MTYLMDPPPGSSTVQRTSGLDPPIVSLTVCVSVLPAPNANYGLLASSTKAPLLDLQWSLVSPFLYTVSADRALLVLDTTTRQGVRTSAGPPFLALSRYLPAPCLLTLPTRLQIEEDPTEAEAKAVDKDRKITKARKPMKNQALIQEVIAQISPKFQDIKVRFFLWHASCRRRAKRARGGGGEARGLFRGAMCASCVPRAYETNAVVVDETGARAAGRGGARVFRGVMYLRVSCCTAPPEFLWAPVTAGLTCAS